MQKCTFKNFKFLFFLKMSKIKKCTFNKFQILDFFWRNYKQKMYFFKFQIFDFFENGQIKNVFFPNYAFKTSPEMLLWRDYQHNAFENLQTQALNPNTIYLRSKHYSPRRAWVPTLREPTSGKLRFPESLLRQPSMGQFNSKRWDPKSFNAA